MDRPTMTRRITGALLVATVLTVGIRDGAHVWAHEESLAAIESFLHGLVQGGAITEAQHKQIERLYESGLVSQLIAWLTAQETGGQISQDTHLYVNALLNLSAPDVSSAVAPADYTGNGNVRLLGHLDAQPPNPYYGDNSTTGMLYNGIWGYATGAREYALQCNSTGLHIIDVTDPLAPYRVQFINMSGGLNPPKGRIWRDVDIYTDPVSGKTYAYIGAQSNGDLWIVDLSFLSGSTAHGANSNPIPAAAIANRGRTNYGHTVSVHDGLGLLFMNTANNGSTLGCQIFDLRQDPFNPPVIASWSGSGHDCHDSFAQADVPGAGGKDLLYVADGYATRYRVVDISSVRTGGGTTLVGSSAAVSGIYAHSNWLDNDAHYLYTFEEFNARDIGVYDVSNPASPTQVTTFQYAEDATANSRIHNGQVRGKYLLTAYYEAGFRVFDISNPANPVEVGKYQTWRDPDGDGTFDQTITGAYNGAWNLHVSLPSGNVLVSDMKSGTFVFRVDPIARPGPASGLSAAAGDTQVSLSWTPASGATGYTVQRGTTSGGPYTTIATNVVGTAWMDTGLSNGTGYFYVVTGTNAEGGGGSSNQASSTPGLADTPVTFTSVAAQDGWVLESSETSNTGGSIGTTGKNASTLRMGDDGKDKQYRSILAFDTSAIPDNATIVSVTVRLLRTSVSGTNPFNTHGSGWVDVQAGGFSGSTSLQTSDFQAAAAVIQSGTLSNANANGVWSLGSLNAAGIAAVNKTGTTQLRVYFAVDDNDNGRADYINYQSGEGSAAANRPQLVVSYR